MFIHVIRCFSLNYCYFQTVCLTGVKGIGGNISGRNVSKPDSSDVGLTKESGLTLEIQPSGHVILGKKGITLSCIAGSNETISWLHNGIPAPPCGLTRCVLLSNGSLHFYKVHDSNIH